MEMRSDWEGLAPEILTLVLQRVQAGSRDRGEGRRIVAVAGVCSSWRQLVLQQQEEEEAAIAQSLVLSSTSTHTSTSTCSSPQHLIRFPAAIRREAAVDFPLQCLLKKKGNSFFLFQTFQNLQGVNEEYLLLGARKHYLPSCSFQLSTDIRNLVKERASSSSSSSSSSFSSAVASVKSNFSRSEFVLADHQNSAPERSGLCVKYSEEIVAGVRQRKLCCGFQPASSSSPGRSLQTSRRRAAEGAPPLAARAIAATTTGFRSFIAWSFFLRMGRQTRRVHSTLEDEEQKEQDGHGVGVVHPKRIVVGDGASDEGAKSRAEEEALPGPRLMSLKSKTPEWNHERGCWSLDFKGRATMASIHNFQLVSSSSSSGSRSDAASAEERVVLQMGKVGKEEYIVDFCSPLSALQAFSICLTSFATNTGLEP
ncbi:unnamed protein product [Sphagnum compactum]